MPAEYSMLFSKVLLILDDCLVIPVQSQRHPTASLGVIVIWTAMWVFRAVERTHNF